MPQHGHLLVSPGIFSISFCSFCHSLQLTSSPWPPLQEKHTSLLQRGQFIITILGVPLPSTSSLPSSDRCVMIFEDLCLHSSSFWIVIPPLLFFLCVGYVSMLWSIQVNEHTHTLLRALTILYHNVVLKVVGKQDQANTQIWQNTSFFPLSLTSKAIVPQGGGYQTHNSRVDTRGRTCHQQAS